MGGVPVYEWMFRVEWARRSDDGDFLPGDES